MSEEALAKYYDFTESDLNANRNGRISQRQLDRLIANEKAGGKFMLVLGIFILLVALVPSTIAGMKYLSCLNGNCAGWQQGDRTFWLIFGGIWTPIWLFFAIGILRGAGKSKTRWELKTVEGPINIVKESRYNSSLKQYRDEYELHVGGVTFNEDSELADFMMQGDVFAIYYVDGTRIILSAELLKKAQ